MKHDEKLLPQVEGGPAAGWTVLDFFDCVLHVFTPEARDRYRLELLWADAPRLELDLPGEARSARVARA
jgi:ribosome-associated protein